MATQVRDAVRAGEAMQSCLDGATLMYPSIPACAPEIVRERGEFFGVAYAATEAVLQVANMARSRGEGVPGSWCQLLDSANDQFEHRRPWRGYLQSTWTSSAQEHLRVGNAHICQTSIAASS
ncbi:hypothetical protein [Polaromonas sp.]|uniref:hypothetical protein n=1 Tax=Polaromonas sp. TaxID=1869339 RepID=UPI00352A8784